MLRSTWSSAASNAAVVWSSAASNGTVDPVKRKAKRNAKRCGRPGKVHRYLWACNCCAMMRLTRLTIAFTGIFRHDANRQPLSSDRTPFCHRTAPRRGNGSCSRSGSPALPAPRTPARRISPRRWAVVVVVQSTRLCHEIRKCPPMSSAGWLLLFAAPRGAILG